MSAAREALIAAMDRNTPDPDGALSDRAKIYARSTLDLAAEHPDELLAWLIEAGLLKEPEYKGEKWRSDHMGAHPAHPGCDMEPKCRHLYVWGKP